VLSDDPADKLYNEGLFLMNQKKDFQGPRRKKVRRGLIVSIRTRTGARQGP